MHSSWAVLLAGMALVAPARAGDYVAIPGGELRTVLPPDGKSAPAQVAPYALRRLPVTNGEFLAFVQAQPQWRRDHVPAVFADSEYLGHWAAPDRLGDAVSATQPVTRVSWFAARAYCAGESARLPTWHEWELAAAADESRVDARGDSAWRDRILAWYSTSSGTTLARVGQAPANAYGTQDLHGLVWEWIEDHGALMVSGDNREQGDPDTLKFCGAGALSVSDRENYAVLMRIAMLSSLQAFQTTRNLGFRCARDGTETAP